MTFIEKLKQDHPDCVSENWGGGAKGCPCDYGYEPPEHREAGCCVHPGNLDCDVCWNREMPAPEKQNGGETARLIYLLGQIKGVAACISEHRIRTTLTNAVNGVLDILQAPTDDEEEDMDK